jgi:hypothetical protein
MYYKSPTDHTFSLWLGLAPDHEACLFYMGSARIQDLAAVRQDTGPGFECLASAPVSSSLSTVGSYYSINR